MPHPDTVYFCVGYAVCLGGISVAAFECIRRFRFPFASFVLGLAALSLAFGFALWLESGLASAGAWSAQGPPYRHFRRAASAVFLVFFLLRGSYLLAHAFRRRSPNAA